MSGIIAGCKPAANPEAAPMASPSPVTPVAAKPTPLATPGPNAAVKQLYRIKTTYKGTTQSSFSISIGGKPAGSYQGSSEQDITFLLRPGDNPVKIAWTVDPKAGADSSAEVEIDKSSGGDWSRIYHKRIAKGASSGSSSYVIHIAAPTVSPSVAAPAAATGKNR